MNTTMQLPPLPTVSEMPAAAPAPSLVTSPALSLRDYQNDAVAAIEAHRNAGKRRALLIMPTGTGKTAVFSHIIKSWNARTLVIAHRRELLEQPAARIRAIWPDADLGIVGGGYNQPGHQVTVASIQSLAHPKRLAGLDRSDPELVIIDEAHHSPAATYRKVIERLGAGTQGGPFLLGVTATPNRTDELSLATLYGEPTYLASLPDMISRGWLADLRGVRIATRVNLDGVPVRAGDFAGTELAEAVDTPARNAQIVLAWQQRAPDRLTVAFCVTVAHAVHLSDAFASAGVAVAVVSGETPIAERERILTDFAAGRIRVLCNCAVLTEGWDCPETGCIVLARPTKSQTLYIQCAGRGARPAPGKKECLIIDVTDVTKRHGLVQLPDLIGREYPPLLPSAKTRADADQDAGEAEEDSYSLREALTRGPTHLEDVNLIKSWPWTRDGATYRLAIGSKGHSGSELLLVPDTIDPTRYQVVHVEPWKRERLAPQALPLGWGQAVAEAAAENLEKGAVQLVDRSAPWRQTPASSKQIYLLRKLRIPFAPGLTKGAASDLLAVTFARQRKGA